MTLIILEQSPRTNIFSKGLFLEIVKKLMRYLTGKRRGPQAVLASVLRGLCRVKYPYKLNPKENQIHNNDTIWVNSSIEALRWAINFKRVNPKTKLIVGPNLVITPDEYDGIIFDDHIDVILQPSEWTKKLYERYNSIAAQKIQIWPAGVEDPYEMSPAPKKTGRIIVFQKNAPVEVFNKVIEVLNKKLVAYDTVIYGTFSHEDFLRKLDSASAMIYLSISESQCIALQEAWIRNVPTLVWDKGVWEYKTKKQEISFVFEQISAPYLTPEAGLSFKNAEEFTGVYETFMNHLKEFTPRNYSIRTLSDKVTTRAYLDIIESL